MLKITFKQTYRKKGKNAGKTGFIYTVSGTPEALEQYKEIQGEFYAEDEVTGAALYFSNEYVGDNAKMDFTKDGTNTYVDTSEMDKMKSLVEQTGGNLGQAIAEQGAQSILGSMGIGIARTVAPTASVVAEDVQPDGDAPFSEPDDSEPMTAKPTGKTK